MTKKIQAPKLRTKEYHDFIGELAKKFEKKLPVSVYGYTDYKHLAFHWLTKKGIPYGIPAKIPFDAVCRICGVELEND